MTLKPILVAALLCISACTTLPKENAPAPSGKPVAEATPIPAAEPAATVKIAPPAKPLASKKMSDSLTIKSSSELSPPSNDLWQRIRNGFGFNDLDNQLVREKEAWYVARPDYVRRMVDRSSRYLFYVIEEVEKRGMPTEIALLPMIESAYNPVAYSRSHASGIWQFIPSTGKHYKLEQSWWYDGRRDVLAATDSALDYLQYLYKLFGDWHIALAAYNMGEGAVGRAIARNQAAGLPTDYESLPMSAETRNYVPKLQAVKNIVANPAAFGLELASIPNSAYFAKVSAKKHIDVKLAAKFADMSVEDFVFLNPAHNRPVITSNGNRSLLLPIDKVDSFSNNFDAYDKPFVTWQSYGAKKGERLDKIAPKFGLSVATLKSLNAITGKGNKLVANSTLLVPIHGTDQPRLYVAETPSIELAPIKETTGKSQSTTYTVKRGDTLFNIAKRYDLTAQQLKAWNGLRSAHVKLGQKLIIGRADVAEKFPSKTTSVHMAKAKHHGTRYKVRRGDTLTSIARRFNVASNDIQRWNHLSVHGLKPGTVLAIKD